MPSPSPEASPSQPTTAPRPSKFRFKEDSKSRNKSKSQSQSSRLRSRSPSPSPHGHRHGHRHRHARSHRRRPSPPDSPSISPDTAFRESLFDALADDEGAAYWEGVYGQPIHTYSRPYTNESLRAAGMEGEPPKYDAEGNPILERMGDEEYAAYVRARMWEKSHQHIVEERERREKVREKERERRREEGKRARSRRWEWTERERRGSDMRENGTWDRSEAKKWKEMWERYLRAWEKLDQCVKDHQQEINDERDEDLDEYTPKQPASEPKGKPRKKIPKLPYPTSSGSGLDISPSEIEGFYRNIVRSAMKEASLLALLKAERVRWHPDKMAQRYGGLGLLDDEARRQVTAVFQAVDSLYGKVLAEKS